MEKDAIKFVKWVMRLIDYSQKKSRRFLARIMIKRKMNFLAPQPFGALQTIAADKVPVFYHPPVMILMLTDTRGASNPHVDIGVIGQNMVLAAHSLGLGSCWIGMIKLILHPLNRKSRRKWSKFFNIKFPYELNEAICLGYPKGKYDGQVAREVQLVSWYEGGMKDAPRIENQGE
jgi:nitroreductase